tara:strand:+ start:715 stop:1866 length:1152 start_codon:yes stop_codon:yes gene_type:complete
MSQLNYRKKIFIFSESRSEFFLLKETYNLLKKKYDVQFIIAGFENSKKFENNLKTIDTKKIKVKKFIRLKHQGTAYKKVALNFSNVFEKLSSVFNNNKPDLLILLGDRLQTLGCAMAANLFAIKILHIHGGELTHGSKDDVFRHIITKLSNFHFTSTSKYKKRVKQLGEHPENISNVGSIGAFKAKKFYIDFKNNNKIKKKNTIVVCINSESNNLLNSRNNLLEILKALKKIRDFKIHFTLASYDTDINFINSKIKKFCTLKKNASYSLSLGQIKFFEEVINSLIVIGNTSSGIIEVPSLKTPTINIGKRQSGRVFGGSVFNCKSDNKLILSKIYEVLNLYKKNKINYSNPYLNNNCLKLINKEISKIFKIKNIKNNFFDLNI